VADLRELGESELLPRVTTRHVCMQVYLLDKSKICQLFNQSSLPARQVSDLPAVNQCCKQLFNHLNYCGIKSASIFIVILK